MVLFDDQGNYIIGGQLALQTKKGQQIPNQRCPQRHPDSMRAARDMVEGNHTTAKSRSLVSSYNCLGMVFATRRTWIEPDHLQMILDDDDYQLVSSESDVQPGDVVVYRNASGEVTHVGIVARKETEPRDATYKITVLSQWGKDGEYFHDINDINVLLGTPSEYWTDRR